MKFSCEKAVLQNYIVSASRAVAQRSTISVLEGILFKAKNNKLVITGYNLAISICCEMEAFVESEGAVVINARVIGDIIRKMPDDIVYFESNDGVSVTIRCGNSEFNILVMSDDDYPEIPAIDEKNSVKIPENTLKNIISQTIFAVSDNDAKLVHTGSLFKIVDNSLTVVSVDGYRLAMRKETLSEKFDSEFSFIVPGKTLSEIERICGETDDNVILSIGRKHMLFKTGNTTLVTRLLDGDFINYDAAIPKNSKVKVSASRRELLESIERVSLLISEQLKNPIRCNFCDGVLKLSCATALGKAHDAVMIEGDGDNIEIGFNHRYFLDALKNAPTDKVYIEINSNLSPCIITPPEGDSFLYMVLPVRLRSSSEDN